MLRSALKLKGYRIEAQDGPIGKSNDLFFDDAHWVIRYLVVDTGAWLPGRRVLLSPVALGRPDWSLKAFPVNLTKEQIERSPGVASDQPVSRQLEGEVVDYFGWPEYWPPAVLPVGTIAAGNPPPPIAPQVKPEPAGDDETPQRGDPHLRSIQEVAKYHIQARDGEIGHIEDFIVDDEAWSIRYVVVDTRNWLPGRKVLLAPDWFSKFDWHASTAATELSRDTVKQAPAYDPSQPVNRDYEGRLYDFYGRPGYWTQVAAPRMHWLI